MAHATVLVIDQDETLRDTLGELLADHGYAVAARAEAGGAAALLEARPDVLCMALDYLRPGDTLVIWKLDRLARSLAQLIETVALLEAREIGLRSLTEQIDTTTASGRLIFHVFGALAEFERQVIRERTRAGLEAARARGRVGGRPRALSAKDIAAAKALLRDPAISVAEVAKRLKVAPATRYRALPGGRAALEE